MMRSVKGSLAILSVAYVRWGRVTRQRSFRVPSGSRPPCGRGRSRRHPCQREADEGAPARVNSRQSPEHDVGVDEAVGLMAEGTGERADDGKAEPLPQPQCSRVRRDHEIELHGPIAETTCLIQAMLPSPCRCQGHEPTARP